MNQLCFPFIFQGTCTITCHHSDPALNSPERILFHFSIPPAESRNDGALPTTSLLHGLEDTNDYFVSASPARQQAQTTLQMWVTPLQIQRSHPGLQFQNPAGLGGWIRRCSSPDIQYGSSWLPVHAGKSSARNGLAGDRLTQTDSVTNKISWIVRAVHGDMCNSYGSSPNGRNKGKYTTCLYRMVRYQQSDRRSDKDIDRLERLITAH